MMKMTGASGKSERYDGAGKGNVLYAWGLRPLRAALRGRSGCFALLACVLLLAGPININMMT